MPKICWSICNNVQNPCGTQNPVGGGWPEYSKNSLFAIWVISLRCTLHCWKTAFRRRVEVRATFEIISISSTRMNEIPKVVSEKKWLNCLIFFSVCVGTFALSLCFRPPHSWSLLFAWAYPVFHSCKRSALFHWDKVILTHAEQFLHFESSVLISGEIPLFPPFPVVR